MAITDNILLNLKTLDQQHEKLEEKLLEKRDAVIERDIDRLEELTEETACLSNEIRELHSRRKQLWQNLTETEDYLSIDDILPCFQPETATKLKTRAASLRLKLENIQKISEEITESLTGRLNIHNSIFNSLFKSIDNQEEGRTYDGRGQQEKSGQKPSVVIDEAV